MRNVLLSLALLLGLSSFASAAERVDPFEAQKVAICEQLVPFFAYAYQLREKGLDEVLTQEIVAYSPELDETSGFPVYAAIKALYSVNSPPPLMQYLYATQVACIKTVFTDIRPFPVWGRKDDRMYYQSPRKDV